MEIGNRSLLPEYKHFRYQCWSGIWALIGRRKKILLQVINAAHECGKWSGCREKSTIEIFNNNK